MALALWDASAAAVAHGISFHIGHACFNDFHFGSIVDVIEEDALNEKSCMQVLEILIGKADGEIVELEDELVTLQKQIAWADEEWSKVCSAASKEKIDPIENSIHNLGKDNVEDEPDFGARPQTNTEPVEKLQEIVKPILENHFHPKEEQNADNIVQNSAADSSTTTHTMAIEKKMMTNPDFRIKVETGKHGLAATEDDMARNLFFKPQMKRKDHQLETVEALNSGMESRAEKGLEKTSTSTPASCLKPEDKMDVGVKHKVVKTEDSNIHGSGLKADEKQKIKTTMNDLSEDSNSSSEMAEKNKDPKTCNFGNALPDDLIGPVRATSTNGMETCSNVSPDIRSTIEVKDCSFTERSTILEYSVEPRKEGTKIAAEIKPAGSVLGYLLNAPNQATDVSDAKQNSSEKPPASPNKIDTLKSYVKKETNTLKTKTRVKNRESILADDENPAASSLLKMLNCGRQDTIKQQPKVRPRCKKKWNTEITAPEERSGLNLFLNPQNQTLKKTNQTTRMAVQEPCLLQEFYPEKYKKVQKISSMNQSPKRKNGKETPSDSCGTEEHGVTRESSLSSSQKKRARPNSPVTPETKRPCLKFNAAKIEALDNTSDGRFPDDSDSDSDSARLKLLSLTDLRATAKQLKLKGYHKFRKEGLQEQIRNVLRARGKSN